MATTGGAPVRVLHIDDSLVLRQSVKLFLQKNFSAEIILDSAPNGELGLQKINEFHPDAVILDIEMPGMNGIEVLRALRETHKRLPVIMFSTLTHQGTRATVDALVSGATDYVGKPSSLSDERNGADAVQGVLAKKILYWARLYQKNHKEGGGQGHPAIPVHSSNPMSPPPAAPLKSVQGAPATFKPRLPLGQFDAVCIGSSTGGPMVLSEMFTRAALGDHPPIFIVQHMPPKFTYELAEKLNALSSSTVVEAKEGMIAERRHVYIAPGGVHLALKASAFGAKLQLLDTAPVNSCKPSVDVLFKSASDVYGRRLLSIMLTGMGSDGLTGTAYIKAKGGKMIAQDEASSVVWGMPGAVVKNNLADMVLDISGITHQLEQVSEHRANPAS
jgi:two-component system chemotaxis response regulator CheB